jgi:hypothetical protein
VLYLLFIAVMGVEQNLFSVQMGAEGFLGVSIVNLFK